MVIQVVGQDVGVVGDIVYGGGVQFVFGEYCCCEFQ